MELEKERESHAGEIQRMKGTSVIIFFYLVFY